MHITVAQGEDSKALTTDMSATQISLDEVRSCILAVVAMLGSVIDSVTRGDVSTAITPSEHPKGIDYYTITPMGYRALTAKLIHLRDCSDAAHSTAKRLSQIHMDHELAAELRDALKSQLNIIDSLFPLILQPAAEAAPTEEG